MTIPGKSSEPPRVALVHDWLTGMRGGERCLEVFAEMFPDAPIFTLIHEKGSVSPLLESRRVHASPLSRWQFLRRRYRKLLPLFPWAIRTLPTDEFDLVISLSHCAAKAVRVGPHAHHVCYCFTPARYLWDLSDTYLDPERASWPTRLAAQAFWPDLRSWDQASASGVDQFIAISDYIAARIQTIYGRDSQVIYPPVELDRFQSVPAAEVEGHYLIVSALAPYKGVDLAVAAFNQSGRQLKIVGKGPDERRLRAIARPNIEFLGWKSDDDVARLFPRARAFLLPCEEDFGITPLESMASGRPVIAFGTGGARETVVDGETGVFFDELTPSSLNDAIARFEARPSEFDPERCRARAAEFDRAVFRTNLENALLAHTASSG